MASSGILSDAIQDIIKNIDIANKEISQKVSERMTEDLLKKTKDIIDEYYSYKKGSYTKYGRTYQLYEFYNAKIPKARKFKKGYIARGTIVFDPSKLEYHSNSSDLYKDVDSDYVYEELFYKGKHPWYSGAAVNDGSYKLVKGGVNINKEFKKFDKMYDDIYLKDYFNDIVFATIEKYL